MLAEVQYRRLPAKSHWGEAAAIIQVHTPLPSDINYISEAHASIIKDSKAPWSHFASPRCPQSAVTFDILIRAMLPTRAAPRASCLLQVLHPSKLRRLRSNIAIASAYSFHRVINSSLLRLLHQRARPQDHLEGTDTSKTRAPSEGQKLCQQNNWRSQGGEHAWRDEVYSSSLLPPTISLRSHTEGSKR